MSTYRVFLSAIIHNELFLHCVPVTLNLGTTGFGVNGNVNDRSMAAGNGCVLTKSCTLDNHLSRFEELFAQLTKLRFSMMIMTESEKRSQGLANPTQFPLSCRHVSYGCFLLLVNFWILFMDCEKGDELPKKRLEMHARTSPCKNEHDMTTVSTCHVFSSLLSIYVSL